MVTAACPSKNRIEYFINLRKSYHFNGSQETHIFLNPEATTNATDQFEIL